MDQLMFLTMEDTGLRTLPHILAFLCCVGVLSGARTYAAQADENPTEVVASHYGKDDGFDGRPRADGYIFNANDPTVIAVHKGTYPLGTKFLLVNPANGNRLYSCARDHMGDKRRQVDVSFAGAQALGFVQKGVTTLLLQEVGTCLPPNLKRPEPQSVS